MRRCRFVLFAACLLLSGHSWASAAVRVAIVPPTFSEGESSREGATLGDYLQVKLHGLPDVDWIERGDLDKILGEAKLKVLGDQGVSGVVLGRLLKADVVLEGTLENPSWEGAGHEERYTTRLTLQVIDLTNASLLAEESMESPAGADGGPTAPAELERAAGIALRLLTTALRERRAAAPALQLAPIFVANAGASPRLDQWEEKWQDALRQEAVARPEVRLLRFQGLEPALQEQKLAHLGFTEADPAVWQNAADGYIWGNYQEVPVQNTVAFEDTEVEAELFLQMGRDEPRRFARRFVVKDFPEVSRAMAREVLEAALQYGKGAPVPPDDETGVGRSIFARICALVNDGYFTTDPKLENVLPLYHYVINRSGENLLRPLQRPPFASQRTAYCRRMLGLACFFDPGNDRAELLRWAADSEPNATGHLEVSLREMEECFELSERMARAGKFDAATFIAAVDAMMDYFAVYHTLGPPPGWMERDSWARLGERHTALLRAFVILLTEKLPAVSAALDASQIPVARRGFLFEWLITILRSDAQSELRLKYLTTARPLTPDGGNMGEEYEHLMADLGDRKGVQNALMQPALPADPPPPRPATLGGPMANNVSTVGSAPGSPSPNRTDLDEPLLAGTTPVPLPRPRRILLPVETLLADAAGQVAKATAAHMSYPGGFGMDGLGDSGLPIHRIDGYGDQLILDLTAGGRVTKGHQGVHLLYQASCDTTCIFKGADSDLICGDTGRALYREGDALAWTDLVSSASGVFSPEEGAPAVAPAMLGFDTAGRVVAVNDTAKTVGQYDWNKHRWLALPAPPLGSTPAPLPAAGFYTRGESGPAKVSRLPALPSSFRPGICFLIRRPRNGNPCLPMPVCRR